MRSKARKSWKGLVAAALVVAVSIFGVTAVGASSDTEEPAETISYTYEEAVDILWAERGTVDTLEADNATLKTKVAALQSDLDAAEATISGLQTDLDAALDAAAEALSAARTAQGELILLENLVTANFEAVTTAQTDADAAQTRADQAYRRASNAKSDAAAAQSTADSVTDYIFESGHDCFGGDCGLEEYLGEEIIRIQANVQGAIKAVNALKSTDD